MGNITNEMMKMKKNAVMSILPLIDSQLLA